MSQDSHRRPNPDIDPYLWLEDIDGERQLDWVRGHNAGALEELEGPRFDDLKAGILEALDADERIPYVRRRGDHLYNFWQDAENPRGLWRRTTLDSYRTREPEWEVLVDVDALAEAEEENWVWQSASVIRPSLDRALIQLSRGGADASVVRELDLQTKQFLPDGFSLPEAKTTVGWIDRDHIFVGTDFGPDSLTTSGYPRLAKRWQRGTPLAEATTVYEGKPEDVAVYASHDPTEGFERDFLGRAPDFFTSEDFLLQPDGSRQRIDVPDDAEIDVYRHWLLIRLRSDWTVEGADYPAGSLLTAQFDDYMNGDRTLTVLFEPETDSTPATSGDTPQYARTSLSYYAWTRDHLIVSTLRDVKSRLEVLTPPTPGPVGSSQPWAREDLTGVPDVAEAQVVSTDPDHDDEYLLDVQSFTQPATLLRGDTSALQQLETLWEAPSFFDPSGLVTRQFFATSEDGTEVPYFVVGPGDSPAEPDTAPTLLNGYGGFEVSFTPSYSATMGRGWLARGGTYVLANIRGGGEYGPAWHQAALRENRPRAYEDFAAVAQDLVSRGITTPERLGAVGGSNGGLLMGVMLTTYPTLFGAIACQVPVLDLRRYHKLLAGASWMAEWGDPGNPDDWAFLQTFSPYHLVVGDQPYPPFLLATSTRDDRVHPAHARKMMARLSEHGYDVRYYENIEGGHGAAANNEQRALLWALVFEFLWQQLASPQT